MRDSLNLTHTTLLNMSSVSALQYRSASKEALRITHPFCERMLIEFAKNKVRKIAESHRIHREYVSSYTLPNGRHFNFLSYWYEQSFLRLLSRLRKAILLLSREVKRGSLLVCAFIKDSVVRDLTCI